MINDKLFTSDIYEKLNKINIHYTFPFTNVNISKNNSNYLILPISDIHYGEIVKKSQVNDINEYNCKIAQERIVKLFDESLKYAEKNKCSELYLMFLGDIFSGNIHDELMMTNEFPISECVMDFYGFISQLIDSIKNKFNHIYINGVVGNHPRFSKKPQNKDKAINSYEYFLYTGLNYKFKNDEKVKVNISKSPTEYIYIRKLYLEN